MGRRKLRPKDPDLDPDLKNILCKWAVPYLDGKFSRYQTKLISLKEYGDLVAQGCRIRFAQTQLTINQLSI